MTPIKFDPEAIRELAKILRETDLTEIELVEKDSRIRVARVLPPPAPVNIAATAPAAPPPAPTPAPAAAAPPSPAPAEADARHPGMVPSPMVGVVYLSPEPGAPPYVTPGARVVQGQTLLLIEAMKTFNQIKAPRAGVVTKILVENGAPVEYGEPLLIIE
jgi:acetyl-CoA carboxylase biotin carboxyl carrier protein